MSGEYLGVLDAHGIQTFCVERRHRHRDVVVEDGRRRSGYRQINRAGRG
jgi:hypothetical protein